MVTPSTSSKETLKKKNNASGVFEMENQTNVLSKVGTRGNSRQVQQEVSNTSGQKRITQMLMTIVFLFLLTYFPNPIYRFVTIVNPGYSSDEVLFWVTSFYFLNSSVNPVIYFFFYPDFRQIFRKLYHGDVVVN